MARVDTTRFLVEWCAGSEAALEEMLPLVYDELHAIAAAYMRRERRDHTLQPTALVHEAYLRLIDQTRVDWRNRAQFLGVAAQMMRRVLLSHARGRQAAKRDAGDKVAWTLVGDGLAGAPGAEPVDLIDLHRVLESLAERDPRKARVVELRYFGGLTADEVATALGLSTATVERDWSFARAWLVRALALGSGS